MKKPPPLHHNQNRSSNENRNTFPLEPSGPPRGHAPQTSLLLRETFPAPPPSAKGRVIGIDCHPDTFTWAVLTGTSLHDARLQECHDGLPLERLLDWAGQQGTPEDTFLMEAGSNSFEICRRLQAMGRRAWVLESAHVGRHAMPGCIAAMTKQPQSALPKSI